MKVLILVVLFLYHKFKTEENVKDNNFSNKNGNMNYDDESKINGNNEYNSESEEEEFEEPNDNNKTIFIMDNLNENKDLCFNIQNCVNSFDLDELKKSNLNYN